MNSDRPTAGFAAWRNSHQRERPRSQSDYLVYKREFEAEMQATLAVRTEEARAEREVEARAWAEEENARHARRLEANRRTRQRRKRARRSAGAV